MKLNQKLFILFVVPLLLVGLLGLAGLLWSRYHFVTTVSNDTTKVKATLEMEINNMQAFQDISDYIHDQKKSSLDSYQTNIKDFDFYLTQYRSHQLNQEELQYLNQFTQHYAEFQRISQQLIKLEKNQLESIYKTKMLLNDKIEKLLEDDWQKQLNPTSQDYISKHNIILNIEINIHKVISAMNGYILDADSSLRNQIENSIDDMNNWIAKLALTKMSSNETLWFNQIKQNADTAKSSVSTVLQQEDQKRELIGLLKSVSNHMDTLLDDKIQAVATKNLKSTQSTVSTLNYAIICFLVIVIVSSIILTWWFIKHFFSKPVKQLKNIAEDIAIGKTEIYIDDDSEGEFAELYPSFKKLIDNTQELTRVAKSLGTGKFDTKIYPRSEDDTLSRSLIDMRDNLNKLDSENKQQVWIKTQIANITQSSQGILNLQKLLETLITNISESLSAGFAAFYFVDRKEQPQADNDAHYLILIGSYGYEERKQISNRIKIGTGLVGQCAFEKKPILLTEVPDDYIKINSGLGAGKPLNVFVIPVLHNDELIGVIEVASFKLFTESETSILKEVATNIGTIISNIIAHEKTQDLLKQSQQMNEELQTQQEELRSSNEKLEEQKKALQQSEEELRSQSEELRVMNEELEEKTESLEQQKCKLEQTQHDLEQRAKDLALSSKYKSEFLANMSHELRTPLNSLLILSNKLANNKQGNLTDKQVKSAEVIHRGGEELLSLINDILDLSKVEAGKLQIEMMPCNIADICENLQSQFEPVAKDKGLSFTIEIDKQLPTIFFSDEQRIVQIIRNFISNSHKFTETGSITLSVAYATSAKNLSGKQYDARQMIAWSVTDTGIGIAKEKQRLIFEAFQQAEGSTSRKYGGTGLGLAISRAMADLMGGDIHLQSEENKGSTFTLYLPLSPEQQPNISQSETAVTQITPTVDEVLTEVMQTTTAVNNSVENSILIVEDDKDFADIIAESAKEKGYDVIYSESGQDALSKAIKLQPQAIILDLGLPDMDGIQVLNKLKDDLKTRHIPVHVISGRDEMPELKQQGAIGYLKKPISDDSLFSVFDKFEQVFNSSIKNVLIVEDDASSREAICVLITSKNIKIHAVEKGNAALDYLNENKVDCIILDLNLPDISGFDLLKHLSEHYNSPPPVIIYTGADLTESQHATLQQYTSSIVVKGVNSPNRLLDEVTLFLHSVESDLSHRSKKVIKMLHSGDEALNNKKVLLVDDDMRNVFALSSELEDYNIEVIIASNGEEAISKLDEEENIDLVLMDIMMPVMDGYESMLCIRKDSRFKSLPIIALTAKAMPGDKEKCIHSGANDYISKPIDINQLISMLKVWLSR